MNILHVHHKIERFFHVLSGIAVYMYHDL